MFIAITFWSQISLKRKLPWLNHTRKKIVTYIQRCIYPYEYQQLVLTLPIRFRRPCTVIFDFLLGFCYHCGPRSTLTHSCGIASFKMAPAGEIFVLRSKFVLGPWKFDLCKRTVNMIILHLLVFWVIISFCYIRIFVYWLYNFLTNNVKMNIVDDY